MAIAVTVKTASSLFVSIVGGTTSKTPERDHKA